MFEHETIKQVCQIPKQVPRAGAKIMREAYNYQEIIEFVHTLIEEIGQLKTKSVTEGTKSLLNEKICKMHHCHGASEAYLKSKCLIQQLLNVLEQRKQ